MIKFPAWVENPGADCGSTLESRRLRFMVLHAAIHAAPNGSIAGLADRCKIERTQVHAAIREGRFSAKMAAQIEKACGRDVVRREWLIFPLETHELTI